MLWQWILQRVLERGELWFNTYVTGTQTTLSTKDISPRIFIFLFVCLFYVDINLFLFVLVLCSYSFVFVLFIYY
jgi:hypothetical protein